MHLKLLLQHFCWDAELRILVIGLLNADTLPVCAPVLCAPGGLTWAPAPGIHHTERCFFDSGSREL